MADLSKGIPPSPKYVLALVVVACVAFGGVKLAGALGSGGGGGGDGDRAGGGQPHPRSVSTAPSTVSTAPTTTRSAPSAPSSPSGPSATPAAATGADRDAIYDAVRTYAAAVVDAEQDPRRPLTNLDSVASPSLVAAAERSVAGLRQRGWHLEPAPDGGQSSLQLDDLELVGGHATATTCGVSDWWAVDDDTGQVLDTTPAVETISWTLTRRPDGSWTITANRVLTHTAGATQCPAATVD